ncbi:MAG: hypothetical protein HY517_01635, partial [Candidatus Aenigmarchaeota archaeon]|nr:hypothetical protein [Candidatus Aenigmarchaeota archaeon]
MDYSQIGKKGARKFWERFYSDSEFREKIIESKKHPMKDPVKSHNAAKIAAMARWKNHKKRNFKKPISIGIPPDTHENILLKYRLCGYLTGDGSLFIRSEKSRPKAIHSDIRFYPDDEKMLDSFLEAFTKLYNMKPKIYRENKFFRLQKSSKIVCRDLMRFTKFGTMEWKIPELKSNKDAKIEWLRAFSDCEAYVGKKAITLTSVNKRGLHQVQKLLKY